VLGKCIALPEKQADKMLGIRIDRKLDKYTPKKERGLSKAWTTCRMAGINARLTGINQVQSAKR